jgi:hypothetical protein
MNADKTDSERERGIYSAWRMEITAGWNANPWIKFRAPFDLRSSAFICG